MKGMRELREVLRTVETRATQNFKVVRPWAALFRASLQWEGTEATGSPHVTQGSRQLHSGPAVPCHAHGRH